MHHLNAGRVGCPEQPVEPNGALPADESEAAARVLELIRDATSSQMVSDVPLGALLSGGLDSSTLTGLMAQERREPIRTFSATYPRHRGYDEADDARFVARHFNTSHHEIEIEPRG